VQEEKAFQFAVAPAAVERLEQAARPTGDDDVFNFFQGD
jgi:hypothetical protein